MCRELARLLGADTAAVYLLDPGTEHLVPKAGYHVPKDYVVILGKTSLPLKEP